MSVNVLFVDDEANVLQGLRRALRPMRDAWSMRFASSGAEALSMLSEMPADAIISDMRMPEMDGGAFLSQVTRYYPDSIRFVLSGQADKETTLGVVGASHQFLPKPCDKDTLTGRISQCLDLKQTIGEHDALHGVASLTSLTSPFKSITALNLLFDDDSPSLDALSSLVVNDPALSAKVLQLAGSAYFGIGQTVNSARQAVGLLGLDVLMPLIQRNALAHVTTETRLDTAAQDLVDVSRATAKVAVHVARQMGLERHDVERTHTVALLLNIGENIELSSAAVPKLNCTETFMVGCYLTALWGLPRAIAWPIRYSHAPQCYPGGGDGVLAAVHIAQVVARAESALAIQEGVDQQFLAKFDSLVYDAHQLFALFKSPGGYE